MLSACCLTRLADLCFILNKGCNILLASRLFDWSVSPIVLTESKQDLSLCGEVSKVVKLVLAVIPRVHSLECPL